MNEKFYQILDYEGNPAYIHIHSIIKIYPCKVGEHWYIDFVDGNDMKVTPAQARNLIEYFGQVNISAE